MPVWQPHLAFPNGLGATCPLVARDFPVAVCWSHKSANTTMLKWFLFQTGLLEQAEAEYPNQMHLFWYVHTSAQPDFAKLVFCALAGPMRKLTVKVIRDPAQRAVSSFLHFVRDPKRGFRDTWSQFLDWKRSTGRDPDPEATFIDFLRFILDTTAAGTLHDPHLQPQWNAAQDPCVIQHIPLEELPTSLRRLEQLCGLRESPLETLSQSPHHYPSTGDRSWPPDASSLPLDNKRLRALGGPSGEALLDDVTLPLIHEAFATDYDAYSIFYRPKAHRAKSAPNFQTSGRRFRRAA